MVVPVQTCWELAGLVFAELGLQAVKSARMQKAAAMRDQNEVLEEASEPPR